MIIKSPLKNKWIVITRPTLQAENLTLKLESLGANVHLFPLLEIKPPNNLEPVKQKLKQLKHYDLAIFVSVNAVEHTLKYLDIEAFSSIKIATTGGKTAALLQRYGVEIDFCPKKLFNSEALLAVSGMKQFCKKRKIAIIRGENGRNFLGDSLLRAGATVDYFDVYQRDCPKNNIDTLKQHWNEKKLDIILLSSGTSVKNFFHLSKNEQWIDELTLLLGSHRMSKQVPSSFKGTILTAEDPSDKTVLKELTTIYG